MINVVFIHNSDAMRRTSEVFPQHCTVPWPFIFLPTVRSIRGDRTFVNARIQHADSDHWKCSDGQNRLEIAKTQPLRPLMHPGAFWSRPAGRSRRSTKSTVYEQILSDVGPTSFPNSYSQNVRLSHLSREVRSFVSVPNREDSETTTL